MEGKDLVIGGFGFIGTNLVKELIKNNRTVIAMDNEFLGKEDNLKGVDCEKIKGDVYDFDFLYSLVKNNNIKRIYYLAGYSSGPMFENEPMRVLDCIKGFMNVLEMGRLFNCKIVYASTSSFYARCKMPFKEDMRILPGTPYELSKYAMEQCANMYSLYHNVSANGLRFFSVYGPHEKYKRRFANNLSQFYWSIKHDVSPIVFGDGSQTRDFTYVGDLVKAIVMIMDKAKGSEVYNIGTGKEYSFNEMIEIINTLLKKDIKPTYIKNPLNNYVSRTRASIKKIKTEIGWKPKTSLKQGIKKIIKFNEDVSFLDVLKLYEKIPLKWSIENKKWG